MPQARQGRLLGWASDLWRHVIRIEPFKKGVLATIVTLAVTSVFAYDGMQFGLTSPRFWLATSVSFALYLTTYVILMLPFAFIPALSRSGLGKMLVFLISGAVRTAIFALVFFEDQADALFLMSERIPGDMTVGIVVWAGIATVTTSSNDYHQTLIELNRVTGELEEQRDKRATAADFAEKRLKQLAVTALQSELEKISHGLRSIGQERDIWRLSAEIKQLIETKVRPLSRDLRNRINLMSDVSFDVSSAIRKSSFITLRVAPRTDSRYWLSYFVAMLNIFVTVGQLSNWFVALTVLAISPSYPILGGLLSGLWRRRARINLSGAVFWLTSSSIIAYLPMLWVLNYWSREYESLVRIQVTAYLVIVLLLVAFSTWSSFQRVRDEQLQSIEEFNTEIKRELALMDQAVWVAQRKWSYLVHGTVQGALTVASARLVFSEDPDKKVITQVIKDVEKAKRALQEAVEFRMSTNLLAKEIVTSWEGICEVSFEIAEDALARLDENEAGRTCVMEVAKELVGNAHRHGKANKVWISSYLTQDDDIKLIVTNNGRPMPENSQPGLGFAMFDELTSDWEIDQTEQSRFTATIPLSS
jgi:signal transduction histidine kinase